MIDADDELLTEPQLDADDVMITIQEKQLVTVFAYFLHFWQTVYRVSDKKHCCDFIFY